MPEIFSSELLRERERERGREGGGREREREREREIERERERENERFKKKVINEGNGISTILFFTSSPRAPQKIENKI